MIKRTKLLAPLALLVVLAVSLSGCGLGLGQQVTAADIIAKMRDTVKTVQTEQSTANISLNINKDGLKALVDTFAQANGQSTTGNTQAQDWSTKLPDSVTATINTWKQSPDKVRAEIAQSSIPGAGGVVAVYDGQKFYAYSPSNNTVYTGTPASMGQMPAELKSALQNFDPQKELDNLINNADIKLLGTEKVAGIDAYKLDIVPKAGAVDNLQLPQMIQAEAGMIIKDVHGTLWVDTNRWIPLKLTVDHPSLGSFTYEASKVDLNQPIDASKFVLQVPGGAKTVDLDQLKSQSAPTSTTLQQASDAASKDGWKLLQPTYLPGNATLVEVLQMPAGMMQNTGGLGFTMNYSSPSANFSIIEGKGQFDKMMGAGSSMMGGQSSGALKDVQVRGVTGKTLSLGDKYTVLFWQEAGSGIWVAVHGNLSLDELTKIAEGLK